MPALVKQPRDAVKTLTDAMRYEVETRRHLKAALFLFASAVLAWNACAKIPARSTRPTGLFCLAMSLTGSMGHQYDPASFFPILSPQWYLPPRYKASDESP